MTKLTALSFSENKTEWVRYMAGREVIEAGDRVRLTHRDPHPSIGNGTPSEAQNEQRVNNNIAAGAEKTNKHEKQP